MPNYALDYPFEDEYFFASINDALHSSEKLNTKLYSIIDFTFSADLMTRWTVIGNRGGGCWDGNYRWLALDKDGHSLNFCMFNIARSMRTNDDPHWGNRNSSIMLIVGRGNSRTQLASLQLNLSQFSYYSSKSTVAFYHDGRLTCSNAGASKRNEVLVFIKDKAPYLVGSDGNVFLGNIRLRDDYSINDPDIYDFLLRTAIYSYYRDCFREAKKSVKRLFHP